MVEVLFFSPKLKESLQFSTSRHSKHVEQAKTEPPPPKKTLAASTSVSSIDWFPLHRSGKLDLRVEFLIKVVFSID
jgi:hypothetical protein